MVCWLLAETKEAGFGSRTMKKYISIDIGGTAIKYGTISECGKLLSRSEMPTEAALGGAAILEKADNIVRKFCEEESYSGICVSTAGMVDTVKGEIVYSAPLIPRYTGTKIKETLGGRFGLPCEVENDVNCAGLAESISGAGKGYNPVLMLTVGTGIGGCLIVDGKVYRGYGSSACEFGYMRMRGSDFQTLGSALSLTKRVAQRKNEPEEEWCGYRIFEQAKQGDAICVKAIDEMTDVLGFGIANICYVVSPQVVILGGGIMAQEDFLKDRIREALNRYLIGYIASNVRIRFAKHKNDAGMLGAFYHFMSCR